MNKYDYMRTTVVIDNYRINSASIIALNIISLTLIPWVRFDVETYPLSGKKHIVAFAKVGHEQSTYSKSAHTSLGYMIKGRDALITVTRKRIVLSVKWCHSESDCSIFVGDPFVRDSFVTKYIRLFKGDVKMVKNELSRYAKVRFLN